MTATGESDSTRPTKDSSVQRRSSPALQRYVCGFLFIVLAKMSAGLECSNVPLSARPFFYQRSNQSTKFLLLKRKVSSCVVHAHLSGVSYSNHIQRSSQRGDKHRSLQAKHLLGKFYSQLLPECRQNTHEQCWNSLRPRQYLPHNFNLG